MITIEELENRIKENYGCIMLKDIKSKKRNAHIFALRLIYYYICINNGIKGQDAMKMLGKDRTTMYHYNGMFENEYKYNAEFRKLVDDLLRE